MTWGVAVRDDRAMSWSLAGTYFENCNCDVTCPCAVSGFLVPGDYERCLVLLAFHVDSGEIDGVDVSGLSYAVVADAPGAMAEGGWRVGLVMDAVASPEQAEALAAVAAGQRGGAPAGFNPFIGEVIGMARFGLHSIQINSCVWTAREGKRRVVLHDKSGKGRNSEEEQ